MTSAPYCNGKSKLSDNKDDRYIDKVEEEEDVKLIKSLNQFIGLTSFVWSFTGTCAFNHYL
jgi:hypothetical protein